MSFRKAIGIFGGALFFLLLMTFPRTYPADKTYIGQEGLQFFPSAFQKKLYPSISASESMNGLPPNLLADLEQMREEDLVGLTCTGRIVGEKDGFYLREANTHMVSNTITDPRLAAILSEAAASVEAPSQLLSGNICRTETGDMVVEYTSGISESHHPNIGKNATTYLTFIDKQSGFTPGIAMIRHDLWPYPGCRTPLLLRQNSVVYYECGFVSDREVASTYHMVDFSRGTSVHLATCMYTYTPTQKKTCHSAGD